MYFIFAVESDGTKRPMASTSDINAAYDLLMRFSKIYSSVKVMSALTDGTDVTTDVISAHGSGGSPGDNYILKTDAVSYVESDATLLAQVFADTGITLKQDEVTF